jgi:hypothetical protein
LVTQHGPVKRKDANKVLVSKPPDRLTV